MKDYAQEMVCILEEACIYLEIKCGKKENI
jgi:hypothetical protein